MKPTTPTTRDQVRAVWRKWRSSESVTKSITAMLAINRIMIADGEKEQHLKAIKEDARRDQEAEQ